MKEEILEFSKSLQDWKAQRPSPKEGTPEDLKYRAVQLAQKYSAKVIAQECKIGFSTLAGWRAELNRRQIKSESPRDHIKKAEPEVFLPYTRIEAMQSKKSTDSRDFIHNPLCTVQIGQLHLDFLDPHFLCHFIVAFNNSLPRMQKIKEKIELDFTNCVVEPNSELGKVYKYFLNHFKELTAFCTLKGAPVCNNETERILKRAIRHRKNSLFFKNLVGAAVGDIHMTLLLTAKENKIDPVKYVAALLFYEKERKENPEAFLPWNFDKTLQDLRASQIPVLPIL